MNISLSKFSTLQGIVSKNDYTQKFEEASKSMKLLSSHQSWFSGKIGLSLSHSLKNLVIHLVKAKQEELTEYNCAKMLKNLCDEYNKKGNNNKNVNNALKIAHMLLEYHSNKENATTGHFSDEIAKFEKTNLFTNSRYTKYSNIKDNNVLAINITRENDNNHSSITINNTSENAEAVSPLLAPPTWKSDTLTTNSFGKKDNNQPIITENLQITPEVVSQTFTNSIKVTTKSKINIDLERLEDKYSLLDYVIFTLNYEVSSQQLKEKIFDKANIDQIITLADNYKKLDKKGKYFLLQEFISKQSSKFSKDKTSSIHSDNESKKIAEELIDNLKKTNYLSTNLFFAENQSFALGQEARDNFLKSLL